MTLYVQLLPMMHDEIVVVCLALHLPFVVHRPGAYAEWDDSNAKLRYDSYFDIIQKTYGGKRELIDIHFYKIK